MTRTPTPDPATIIDPSGSRVEATPTHANGKWAFSDFQNFVGGYVEVVRLPGAKVALVNEDGVALGLAPNPAASAMLGIPVVGTVVIVSAKAIR